MTPPKKNLNQKASKSIPRALFKTGGSPSDQLKAVQTSNIVCTNTTSSSNTFFGSNNDRVVKVGDSTYIVETPKDVYINTTENTTVQQYISTGSGGGGTPGGSTTQFQFNNSGAFAGSSGLTYKTSNDSIFVNHVDQPLNTDFKVTVDLGAPPPPPELAKFVIYDIADSIKMRGIKTDSSGNFIIAATDTINTGIYIFKVSSANVILWQKYISTAPYTENNISIAIDNSDNIILTIPLNGLLKLDSSGNILWQKNYNVDFEIVITDSVNNIWLPVYFSSLQYLIKVDGQNGNILLEQEFLYSATNAKNIVNIASDSTGNLYVLIHDPFTSVPLSLIKIDSLGVILWQIELAGFNNASGLTVDAAGDIYVSGQPITETFGKTVVVKILSTDGSFVWQTCVDQAVTTVVTDPKLIIGNNNNLYVYGVVQNSVTTFDEVYYIELTQSTGAVGIQRVISNTLNKLAEPYFASNATKFIFAYDLVTVPVESDFYTATYTYDSVLGTGTSITASPHGYIYTASNYTVSSQSLISWISGSFSVVATTNAAITSDGTYISSTVTLPTIVETANGLGLKLTSGKVDFIISGTDGSVKFPGYQFPADIGTAGSVFTSDGTAVVWGSGVSLDINSTLVIGTPSTSDYQKGDDNIFIGEFAGYCNTTGGANNFFGRRAGNYTTTGVSNNFLGYSAGRLNTSGSYNNFLGDSAGRENTTGSYNNFLTKYSGYYNTTGSNNNFFGYNAGNYSTTGSNNNYFGNNAGNGQYSIFNTGSDNNFFGYYAGYSNNTGCANNFFGNSAGYSNITGNFNNFFGQNAGNSNSSGCFNNFFGNSAGQLNISGSFNNFFGNQAGWSNTTGCLNNFFGDHAGFYNTIGFSNVFIGPQSGEANTSGSYNIYLGQAAGLFASAASNNILIGCMAGTLPSGLASITTQSNRIIVGNNSHTCAQVQVAWTVVSDCRDKHIYCRLDKGRSFLQDINPIVFSFKDRETDEIKDPKKRYGFSAQEILQAEGDDPVIVGADDPNHLGMTQEYLIPILVNAVKELSSEFEALKQESLNDKARITALETFIATLKQ